MAKSPPTFLKVYVVPVLLLNLIVGSWSVLVTLGAPGVLTSLGYAVIVTVSMYLYLLYLDRYLFECRPERGHREQEHKRRSGE